MDAIPGRDEQGYDAIRRGAAPARGPTIAVRRRQQDRDGGQGAGQTSAVPRCVEARPATRPRRGGEHPPDPCSSKRHHARLPPGDASRARHGLGGGKQASSAAARGQPCRPAPPPHAAARASGNRRMGQARGRPRARDPSDRPVAGSLGHQAPRGRRSSIWPEGGAAGCEGGENGTSTGRGAEVRARVVGGLELVRESPRNGRGEPARDPQAARRPSLGPGRDRSALVEDQGEGVHVSWRASREPSASPGRHVGERVHVAGPGQGHLARDMATPKSSFANPAPRPARRPRSRSAA